MEEYNFPEDKENEYNVLCNEPVNPDAIELHRHSSLKDYYDFTVILPITEVWITSVKHTYVYRKFVDYYFNNVLRLRGLSGSFPQTQNFDCGITISVQSEQHRDKIIDDFSDTKKYFSVIDQILKMVSGNSIIGQFSQVTQKRLTITVDKKTHPFIKLRFGSIE